MPAEVHVFRCLQDNVGVLVHDPETGACAAIDAPEDGPILTALAERGWRLSHILVTHRHRDHVQGIAPLRQRFDVQVVAPARARDEVPADRYVGEGDAVRVGSLVAQVLETPGHCIDHVTYWFAEDELVFAGDVIFTLGCGRVMENSPETLWASLQRLAALPPRTQVFSGHDYTLSNARFALAADPDNQALKQRAAEAERAQVEGRMLIPSTIEAELATNPFLRASEPALQRSVQLEGADPALVFAALREWKNRF